MKTVPFFAALVLATLGVYETGVGQEGRRLDSGPNRVFSWLREASAHLSSEGYVEYRRPEGFVGRTGQTATMRLTLEGGREYQILGMCDEACENLDLALFDPTGALLDSDNAQDDVPFISSRPARTGTYHLRVTMRGCTTEACFFAVTVVVK